jgi:tetratricopeptide (TPR) repeat protein
MKKIILLLLVSMFSISLMAGEYESAVQKGIDMLRSSKTADECINAVNYFERVSEANKSEWLPLYYAAYASLSAGFRVEKEDLKDQWYQKGIEFIEKANKIKPNESEILTLHGYLKLMYISNSPMLRAPTQTSDAIEILEKAKALNPANPRPWFVHGQNTLFTPGFFGGGAKNAQPLLQKAVTLYASFKPSGELMPVWGKERCEKLLNDCNKEIN